MPLWPERCPEHDVEEEEQRWSCWPCWPGGTILHGLIGGALELDHDPGLDNVALHALYLRHVLALHVLLHDGQVRRRRQRRSSPRRSSQRGLAGRVPEGEELNQQQQQLLLQLQLPCPQSLR